VQAQEVMSQASFYSSNDPRLHFGLGANRTTDLEVRWPNGSREKFDSVPCDRLVVIREDSGIVRQEEFG
jgi:hypothetical protein